MSNLRCFGLSLGIVASILVSGCYSVGWVRQDGDSENRSSVGVGTASFAGIQLPTAIQSQVIQSVVLSPTATDYELVVTTRLRTLETYDRQTGAKHCSIPADEVTTAPTVDSGFAYAGGTAGQVWKFDLRQCLVVAGWPNKAQGGGTAIGPPIVEGGRVYVAMSNGIVTAFDTSAGASSAAWQSAPISGTIVGSMAYTYALDVYGPNANSLVTLIVANQGAGLVLFHPLMSNTGITVPVGGNLSAGPSIGLVQIDFHKVAVVIVDGPVVKAIDLTPPYTQRWMTPITGPTLSQITSEASIADQDVYLSTGRGLVGLHLNDGTMKWSPLNFDNSGGALRSAVASTGSVYVADETSLKVIQGTTGAQTNVLPIQGIMNIRPSIGRDGTVFTGTASTIYQFH